MDSLPPRPMLIVLIIMFVFSVVNTLAKTAVVAVSDAWLKQQAEDGNKRAKRISKLLGKNSTKIMDSLELASVALMISFCSIAFCLIYLAIGSFVTYITRISGDNVFFHLLTSFFCITIVCFFYSTFLVLVPKRIGIKKAENLTLLFVGYIKLVSVLVSPFVRINNIVAKLFSWVFGVKDDDISEEVTEEEIRMLVDIGSESGAIDDDEKQMIHNIFEMDDKPVEEIMTHRREACILWIEDSIEEWKNIINETHHTRYPVCGESIDDVLGVVSSRDFYRMLINGDTDVETILRDAFFIPDTIKADELFSKMQRENEHMAIVMDEFGGFQGIITQEDLIEEIVGELYSEYDEIHDDKKEIVQLNENTWEIWGYASIEEVEEALGIRIEDGDFNTFAGLIFNELQEIPADGETVELETNNMSIKVTSVADHRIEKALVCVITPPEEDEDDTNDEESE